MKFNIGFVCCGLVSTHLLFNLGLIVYHNVHECKESVGIGAGRNAREKVADREK